MMQGLRISILLLLLSPGLCAQDKEVTKSIYFGGGSWYIDEEQILELKEFIEGIENISNYTVTVVSHTDNIGGAEYNNWLSNQRSRAAVRQLLENNITLDQIVIDDRGQFNPLYDNRSAEGRQMNRRVDIIFTPLIL